MLFTNNEWISDLQKSGVADALPQSEVKFHSQMLLGETGSYKKTGFLADFHQLQGC